MNHKAFTLIELLVVVLIIGILSAIALPQYTQAVEKSRAAEALANIGSFKRAIDVWRLAHPDVSARGFTGDCYGAGELDIDIPSDWVQGTSGMATTISTPSHASCSKNFCYHFTFPYWGLKAHRANSSTYKYVIYYYWDDNTYHCDGANEAGRKLCKSLSNMDYVGSYSEDY